MHNPSAGDEDHSERSLVGMLEAAGHEVEWQSTKASGWEDALAGPFDLVAIAGGDGTVRKVLPELVGRGPRVTLLPIGSANNIARSLGFDDSEETERLARAWAEAPMRPFDVGSLSFGEGELHFLESTGGGLFADLLLAADDEPSGDDKIEHGLQMLKAALAEVEVHTWEIELDGTDHSAELIAFEVMNIREAGPNVPLAPDADPGDGLIDAVLIGAGDIPALRDYVEASLAGHSPMPPRLDARRARRIAFRPPVGSALRLDDEILRDRSSADERHVARIGGSVEVLVPRL